MALVDVLTSASSWSEDAPLLTYSVPDELQGQLCEGQLVAIPYGERLVEGIVWHIDQTEPPENVGTPLVGVQPPGVQPPGVQPPGVQPRDSEIAIRPIAAIIDAEPALLPHQRALAEWMAEYYVTPLAQVALRMLPPGLIQRSQAVLRLGQRVQQYVGTPLVGAQPLQPAQDAAGLRLHALIGLLLSDGEIDVERLQELLGPKRARELVKEAAKSGVVERVPQLATPRARKRTLRMVRLVAQGETLVAWREHAETIVQQRMLEAAPVNMAPDNVRRRPMKHLPDPWAIPAANTLTLEKDDAEALLAQRQLAAIELLEQTPYKPGDRVYWTPNKLCKASKLTVKQLQTLMDEGIIAIEAVEVQRDPMLGRVFPPSAPLQMTPAQQHALDEILAGHDRPILLHGVTGSGKTEVYLQTLAAVIAQGKRGIVLVPEIALTTQAVARVAGRFPGRVAIIHGDLYVGERYDEWRRIRSSQVDVVIGARSALFAPLPDLGLIILDEEHEPAYKQSEFKPTYHAREAAITLGYMLRIPVVLGSATPAVESFYRAEVGDYHLVELPRRIGADLPPVEIIDLRNELHAGNTSIISRRLQEELERVLRAKQQVILFLNRRGAASCVLCRECGYVAMCDRCDTPLTYHSTERILLCHYCNRQARVLTACPQCQSQGIRYFGLGTEKVIATIQQQFPTARLLRWDRDTATNHRAHQDLLDRFANREADILVGTQMIAKGLDLPGVTLVGVISADIALNLPDYAAPERAFSLLTQVAGRAGRGAESGTVIVQTFNPQHFCVDTASRHDYHEFYAAEIEARRRYGYPPFRQFAKFTYSHEQRRRAQNEAFLLREQLDEWIDRLGLRDTDIVGPAPAFMERLNKKYRWQMIARGPDLHPLLRVINAPGWSVDIDPVSTM
ncbi:MAG: primosomal protein N' [Ktedonobacteraceae bacterium]